MSETKLIREKKHKKNEELNEELLESNLPSLVKFNRPRQISLEELMRGEAQKKRPHSRIRTSSTMENLLMTRPRTERPENVRATLESCNDALLKGDLKTHFLNSIIPPSYYVDDRNYCWEITISDKIATRKDIITLRKKFDRNMILRRAAHTGICPVRQGLYSQLFDELIRQVTSYCATSGLLLLRIKDELNMSIQTLQYLAFDAKEHRMGLSWKTKMNEEEDSFFRDSEILLLKKDREETEAVKNFISESRMENKKLAEKRNSLRNRLDILEQKTEDYLKNKNMESTASNEEFWYQKRYNTMLKVHLEETILSLEIQPELTCVESSVFDFVNMPVITECSSVSVNRPSVFDVPRV